MLGDRHTLRGYCAQTELRNSRNRLHCRHGGPAGLHEQLGAAGHSPGRRSNIPTVLAPRLAPPHPSPPPFKSLQLCWAPAGTAAWSVVC
ncbi:hypothetical protein ABBQ32_005315 [Trebouxia sp. C0010 RCD-2024]